MTLTPKEEALELVNMFMPHSNGNSNNNEAIESALIIVDKLIQLSTYTDGYYRWTQHYEEVKQEIKKL
jgi:uncharacterized UPF0160 family protein